MMRAPILLLLCLVPAVWCSCKFIPRSVFDQDDDDMSCEHPDYTGVTITLGGNFLTPDCHNVTCDEPGLYVCGFGWALASVMALPGDCEAERVDECGVRFVKRDDSEKPCFEGVNSALNPIV